MSKQTLQKTILKTIKESIKGLNDKTLIPVGDIKGLVNWLDSPENWEAAAKAVSMGRGEENDLVNFVKAHREFDDWSWVEIKDAIDQANDMDLMENFKNKMKIVRLIECACEKAIEGFDKPNINIRENTDSDLTIDSIKKKIAKSKNAQLINIFDLILKKYQDKLTTPKNLAVISKAIDIADSQNRWADLERWFMDQTIKFSQKQHSLQEFVLKVKK